MGAYTVSNDAWFGFRFTWCAVAVGSAQWPLAAVYSNALIERWVHLLDRGHPIYSGPARTGL